MISITNLRILVTFHKYVTLITVTQITKIPNANIAATAYMTTNTTNNINSKIDGLQNSFAINVISFSKYQKYTKSGECT